MTPSLLSSKNAELLAPAAFKMITEVRRKQNELKKELIKNAISISINGPDIASEAKRVHFRRGVNFA